MVEQADRISLASSLAFVPVYCSYAYETVVGREDVGLHAHCSISSIYQETTEESDDCVDTTDLDFAGSNFISLLYISLFVDKISVLASKLRHFSFD